MTDVAILIVDDTESSLFVLKSQLQRWGYALFCAESGAEALNILKHAPVDLVISDQVMPGMDGLELLKRVREHDKNIPFIMLTAHGSIDKAVASMKGGAVDYLTKPYETETLRAVIERAVHFGRLNRENAELRDYLSAVQGFRNIITHSPEMMETVKLAGNVAGSDHTTVLIMGESGVGKELMARAIHAASGCIESRFVGVNCAGIPAGLLETELFGHVKGAFTGADRDREGKFSLARGGSLLLDEIGDMPLDLQAKLLRAIQERTYEKVGADRKISFDARIIATTHRNLEDLTHAGAFREDLYHRINMFPLTIPPLRERREDIPLLADYFIERFKREFGRPIPGISEAAMDVLVCYNWPGNVRELKNCLERAVIINNNELIRPGHLTLRRRVERVDDHGPDDDGPENDGPEDEDAVTLTLKFEKDAFSLDAAVGQILNTALEMCDNNKVKAARLLGVNRKMFYRRK